MAKAKKEWVRKEKTPNHSVCSGCIDLFPDKELKLVNLGGHKTVFCDPCIESKGFSEDQVDIISWHESYKEANKKRNPWKKEKEKKK